MTNADSIPTIILCGGRGTRISEYNPTIPKPMVPIGGRPILWHIMKIYASGGHRDFILALGWLGDQIRSFFLHYEAMTCDFRIDLGSPGQIEYLHRHPEAGWRVTCLDTGLDSLTGTRVKHAVEACVGDTVMVTYGDCVGDVDIDALLRCHRDGGRLATMTVVQPPSRFGEIVLDDKGRVADFSEKPQTSSGAINGGFMVFERQCFDKYFPNEGDFMLEREPLSSLAADGQLTAFEHRGFWQPMDTPRERELLEGLWQSGQAPWKRWG